MASNEPQPKPPGFSVVQSLAIAGQFGATLAVGVVLGLVVGNWLDGQFHTGFIFTFIGVFLGLATAGTSAVTLYRSGLRRSERDWRAQTASSAQDSANDQTDL
jgi:F0F1-type ATP synthase assembly protein I